MSNLKPAYDRLMKLDDLFTPYSRNHESLRFQIKLAVKTWRFLPRKSRHLTTLYDWKQFHTARVLAWMAVDPNAVEAFENWYDSRNQD